MAAAAAVDEKRQNQIKNESFVLVIEDVMNGTSVSSSSKLTSGAASNTLSDWLSGMWGGVSGCDITKGGLELVHLLLHLLLESHYFEELLGNRIPVIRGP